MPVRFFYRALEKRDSFRKEDEKVRYRSISIVGAVLASLLCVINSSAQAQTYTPMVLYPLSPPPGMLGAQRTTGHQGITAGQMVASGASNTPQFYEHAILWNANGVGVDLHPAGFLESIAVGTDGVHQVGRVPNNGRGLVSHAFLWSGTAASVVDLHPAGFHSSAAYGVQGNQQVGSGAFEAGGLPHALVWNGTAASAVDLHPAQFPGFQASTAYGTDGTRQVGEAQNHAMLWSGSAASAVDLHPSGFSNSIAFDVSGTQQVGIGYNLSTSKFNALLWTGSAASMVNLNPAGYSESYVSSTNGSKQVGHGFDSAATNNPSALVWSGTADSVIDLGEMLPSNLLFSEAITIDDPGNIFGIARDASGNNYAVAWIVPEPSSLSLLMLGISGLRNRRRRR